MAIWCALDDSGITTPAGIGAALGMTGLEAAKPLSPKVWREENIELLEAAALCWGGRTQAISIHTATLLANSGRTAGVATADDVLDLR